jgi:hypothetical protein
MTELLLHLSGFYPLFRAWQANAQTTLRPALAWATAAWTSWTAAAWAGPGLLRYLALCLTGCAGVAVLGARRPIVGAWNFVVGGLLAVLLLPVAQGLGEVRPQGVQVLFLAALLAVPVANYLPTRLAAAALALGGACAVEVAELAGVPVLEVARTCARGLLPAAPWLGLLGCPGSGGAGSEFNRVWHGFRDRFGFLWAQRLREQFNRAAQNAGWPVRLAWSGLRREGTGSLPAPEQLLDTLRAALKRFGAEELATQ